MVRIRSRNPALAMLALLGCGFCQCVPGQAPASAHDAFFNILNYGAHRDGSANSTDAFRLAIEAAHKAGGGTVYVPPGNYVTGPIQMVSNLTLFFDAGAVVRFPATVLPFTPGRQQGIETPTPIPLIGGHDLENVAVIGRGRADHQQCGLDAPAQPCAAVGGRRRQRQRGQLGASAAGPGSAKAHFCRRIRRRRVGAAAIVCALHEQQEHSHRRPAFHRLIHVDRAFALQRERGGREPGHRDLSRRACGRHRGRFQPLRQARQRLPSTPATTGW